jgi:hypothetical protein
VDWEVGDQVVIATSANYHLEDTNTALVSNEVVTITAINGRVLTLGSALAYEHLSTIYDLNWKGLVLKKQVCVVILVYWERKGFKEDKQKMRERAIPVDVIKFNLCTINFRLKLVYSRRGTSLCKETIPALPAGGVPTWWWLEVAELT